MELEKIINNEPKYFIELEDLLVSSVTAEVRRTVLS